MSHKDAQLDIAERLQLMLLQDFERLIASGEASPTDRATLARLLMQNGWSIDPTQLPKGILDLLGPGYDPKTVYDDDADVVGKIA